VPQLPNTLSVLEGIENAIRREVPELFGDVAPPSVAAAESAPHSAAVSAASTSAMVMPVQASPLDGPRSLGEAAAALEDIETYFSGNEPSSPALLLVHQARKLIGRPLIEAVEALAGSRMDSAQIKLGPPGGFTLSIERLRQLSSSAGGGQPVVPVRRADQKPVTNRSEAQAVMLGVEQFLSAHEPSSPIPLLLGKARQLMVKDFPALLSELIEPSTS
jgi:type VI secretion system protein ImpA